MEYAHNEVNHFLSEVFNDVLKTEEACIANEFDDLSFRELHVIEAVCSSMEEGIPHTSADIAGELHITAGTLTTSVSLLEKKGYLIRQRDENDKRIVRIYATEKGIQANLGHKAFHLEMVSGILSAMSESEASVLVSALRHVDEFYKDKYAEWTAMKSRD